MYTAKPTMSSQRIHSSGHQGGLVSGWPYTGLLPACWYRSSFDSTVRACTQFSLLFGLGRAGEEVRGGQGRRGQGEGQGRTTISCIPPSTLSCRQGCLGATSKTKKNVHVAAQRTIDIEQKYKIYFMQKLGRCNNANVDLCHVFLLNKPHPKLICSLHCRGV